MWWTKVQVLPESFAPLAQQVERCAYNAEVMGSIPIRSTGSLAQWQSTRLLTEWSEVRSLHEPYLETEAMKIATVYSDGWGYIHYILE